MATELERVHDMDLGSDHLWSARALHSQPDAIKQANFGYHVEMADLRESLRCKLANIFKFVALHWQVHTSYLEGGADVITTCRWGTLPVQGLM